MVLKQTSGGWTATEVDPAVTSDVSLIEAASQAELGRDQSRHGNPVFQGHAFQGVVSQALVFQALVVLAAALTAGLVVFFVVRAAVNSGADPDEQAQDFNELPTVGLDPDDPDGDASTGVGSSRSGSKRDAMEDGIPEGDPDQDPEATAAQDSATAEADPPPAIAATDDDVTQSSTPADETAGNPISEANGGQGNTDSDANANNPASASTTTTANPTQQIPPTTAARTTTTTAASTTLTTAAPPTSPEPTTATTTATTATTAPTTTSTTIASTTSTSIQTVTTLATTPLIGAPIEGSVHTWETGVLFEAKTTPDAARYCWEFESADTIVQKCSVETDFALSGGEAGVNPGLVVVTAEAQDATGEVLNSETITIKVIAREIIETPDSGARYDRGDAATVRFTPVPTATEYCVTLSQGLITKPTLCDEDGQIFARFRRFEAGPVTMNAEVLRGQQIIGLQTIDLDYRN